jgi:hypothetical protein
MLADREAARETSNRKPQTTDLPSTPKIGKIKPIYFLLRTLRKGERAEKKDYKRRTSIVEKQEIRYLKFQGKQISYTPFFCTAAETNKSIIVNSRGQTNCWQYCT